ncbi:MAG: hypothetical protein C4522_10385 [Desulfobacteraceae bacterium]|nr:MAG: hypothetical protein C4522_10385 [Desulfobacteraceae bacterium]
MSEKENQNDLMIQQLVSVEKVSLNLAQFVVVTTEDKLRLKLQNHLSEAEKSKEWIAPLSLLVSLSLALLSADFKDFFLPADTWKAIFIISTVTSCIWMIFALKRAFCTRSIDSLIEEIKSETNFVDGSYKSGSKQ